MSNRNKAAKDALPCPFCAGTPVAASQPHDGMDTEYWYQCVSCGVQGPWAKNPAGALRMWNLRSFSVDLTDKCETCRWTRGEHQHLTQACPVGKKSRVGWTSYSPTYAFTPKGAPYIHVLIPDTCGLPKDRK